MIDIITFNENNGITLSPTRPFSRFSEEITFSLKIDPLKQNYLTLKLNCAEKYSPIFLYLDDKQVGYAKCSDFEPVNLCYGSFYPQGSFFVTTAIPIWYTKGKEKVSLTIRQAEPYDNITEASGTIFSAFTTIHTSLDLPLDTLVPSEATPICYTDEQINAIAENYISSQVDFFNNSLEKLLRGEKLSITKYVEEFRHFCMMLFEPYCPLTDKREAVELVLNCINLYVKEYFENPTTLLHNAHQSDWGGYYGELGDGLYIIESLIDTYYGRENFRAFLSSPFDSSRTIKQAWETCLKANFDFASARQSYIYNQTYYTYEGAWKAMAGLGVIESSYYIGKEKCDLILKEALGLAPWKGEHILLDKTGRELDLYHCLFNHDKNAQFTHDFINIVCTGEAVQGMDEKGNFLRRKPYGEHYYPLTHKALSRENGYVGNYGETCNYLPEWVYRTFNHGDTELSDQILKVALKNISSRLYMRYPSLDQNKNPIMLMEQAIDERNPTMNPKSAYGAIINDKRTLLFASLKRHMDENSERYASPEWEEYKEYAIKAIDALCEQHMDGHLSPVLESLGANYNDFRCDRTIKDIFAHKITGYLPHSPKWDRDFVFFDMDNLLLSLRDGTTHIFAQLNHRNRGYSGYGRAHIIKNGTHHLTQFATDAMFTPGGMFLRQQNVNMDFIYDSSGSNSYTRAPEPLQEFGATAQYLCGEEQFITYQEGIGKVLRENFEVDTPYSGYPDFIWAKVDKYLIVCNTTRESYKNAKDFTLPFKVNGEAVTLKPFSYKVIKTDLLPSQSSVKFINAILHREGVLLSWKATEGEGYNIYRNGEKIASVKGCTYLDKSVCKNGKYSYAVTAVSDFKESHESPKINILFEDIPTFIGNISDEISFGTGNDYHALERNIYDNMPFFADAVTGSVSVTGKKALMARESYSPNARYAYIGFENDKIIIRTRSRNTIYAPGGQKLSPLYFEFEKGRFTQLKLLVDKNLHSVCFFASEGNSWKLLHREILPLPTIFYIGALSEEYSYTNEEYLLPFPLKSVQYADGTISIQKGIDTKYLLIEASSDGKIYKTEIENLIAQSYTPTEISPYYRITPISSQGIKGDSITIKTEA